MAPNTFSACLYVRFPKQCYSFNKCQHIIYIYTYYILYYIIFYYIVLYYIIIYYTHIYIDIAKSTLLKHRVVLDIFPLHPHHFPVLFCLQITSFLISCRPCFNIKYTCYICNVYVLIVMSFSIHVYTTLFIYGIATSHN